MKTELKRFVNAWENQGTEKLVDTRIYQLIGTTTGIEKVDERSEEIIDILKSDDDLLDKLRKFSEQDLAGQDGNIIKNYVGAYISESLIKEEKSPNIVDFFCGAGGLSLGFVQEGFKINFANDIEKSCVETYRFNHPTVPKENIICSNIDDILDDVSKYKRFENVDLVIGGPPCQGFSTANRQRLIDDPRNKLYKSFIKAVDSLQPKFIVMENVKGMKKVANQVIEDFKSIGYSVDFHLYNVKDFGVPQNRERLIFIGNRLGADNKKIHEEICGFISETKDFVLKDALYGLRELEASRVKNATNLENEKIGFIVDSYSDIKSNEYIDLINQNRNFKQVLNHKARYNNDRDIEIYGRLHQGDKSDDEKIADIMPYKSRSHIFKDKYFKLEEEKVCKTITAHMKFDCNMYIHPTQARGLTPREAARVQSYPDDYYFKGAYTKTYMQIGNSVPPLFARYIAKVIRKYIGD
ncbi:DNA cytosine methyltransferase [Streptococcus sp. 19428wA2_WM07]|uniref:DNA cytosine methyltransferase n=1 Tax=Streptococcus sp. 19428wA2_WM07 TaxID=2782468 RepID=UPI001D16E203|nr:DNA cytosine methyltransferase [Streptococcus sp. 19428wA2_WM07]